MISNHRQRGWCCKYAVVEATLPSMILKQCHQLHTQADKECCRQAACVDYNIQVRIGRINAQGSAANEGKPASDRTGPKAGCLPAEHRL